MEVDTEEDVMGGGCRVPTETMRRIDNLPSAAFVIFRSDTRASAWPRANECAMIRALI